jgi:hypothetical protein
MEKPLMMMDAMFSCKQAADYLQICTTTLDRLDIPRTQVRRRVFYRPSVLDLWLAEHTQKKRKGV